MKRIIVIILLILLGIGVVLYPHLSNYLAEKNQSYAIQDFQEKLENTDQQEIDREWEKARQYNRSLQGTVIKDPFVEGSGMVLQDDYKEVLNIDGVMGYIEIPKINVKLSIFHGTSDDILKKGVGHLEGTSLPVGGENGHSVLTGHTGLSTAKLFTDLVDIKKGDCFYLHILDHTLAYEVDQIKIVNPENTKDLERVAGMDYVTLVTCTPYGVNSHRLLVRGTRIPYELRQKEAEAEKGKLILTSEQKLLIITGITSVITSLCLAGLAFLVRWRKRRDKSEN